MFSYDPQLAAATKQTPQSIPAVLQLQQVIGQECCDTDGLKWFNWLYYHVTDAVAQRVTAGGFNDPAWLSKLDVQFANLYFNALHAALSGAHCPGCWDAIFDRRSQSQTARIQFALAGMNAHINHDLPLAIVGTCKTMNTPPRHGTAQYQDYTSINATLDAVIDDAKQTLHVRLPGDPLPPVSHLEDLFAAWNLAAAREAAWKTAESLWEDSSLAARIRMDTIDGLTTVIGKALLVPVR